MLWQCSYCEKEADYHATKDGKHYYFCQQHWGDYLWNQQKLVCLPHPPDAISGQSSSIRCGLIQ
jgi:hypothetical protein